MPALSAALPRKCPQRRAGGAVGRLSAAGLALLALTLVFSLAAPAAARPPGPDRIRFSDGKVSLDIKDAPAGDLLEELGKKGGFKVKFRGEVDKIKLSDSLKNMTMQEALRRLLLGHNYMMTTDSSGAVVSLYLIAPEQDEAAGKARRLPSRPPARASAAGSGRVTHVGASTSSSAPDQPPALAQPPGSAPPRTPNSRSGPIRGPVRRPRP